MIDDFPAFGVVISFAERLAKVRKSTTAPNVLPQNRLESHWRKLGHEKCLRITNKGLVNRQ
jgi:hypothetical protein